jgi:hypothetical protein
MNTSNKIKKQIYNQIFDGVNLKVREQVWKDVRNKIDKTHIQIYDQVFNKYDEYFKFNQ